MRHRDLLNGLASTLLGAAAAIAAARFPPAPGQAIGPGGFPLLIGIGLAVCGVMLAWSGVRSRGTAPVAADAAPTPSRASRNVALVLGGVGLYALALETVGFFLAAFALLVALFLAFGVSRKWLVPIAAAVTIALHVVFYTLLRVPLPWGWLEGFAW